MKIDGLLENLLQLTCINCNSRTAVDNMEENVSQIKGTWLRNLYSWPSRRINRNARRHFSTRNEERGSDDASGGIQQRSYYICKHSWKQFCLTWLLCHWHTSHTSGKNKPVISFQLWVVSFMFIISPHSLIQEKKKSSQGDQNRQMLLLWCKRAQWCDESRFITSTSWLSIIKFINQKFNLCSCRVYPFGYWWAIKACSL